ncbi:Hypothetical predicted protein, partial [Paramuricea clavata]
VSWSDSRSICCYGENGIFYCGSVAASGCPNGLKVSWSDSGSTCCYGENGIFYCGSVAVLAASGCPNGLK